MGKTKENKKTTKGKHKAKPTIGDIIFRVLIIVMIFFIVVITYTVYLKDMVKQFIPNNIVNIQRYE